MCEQKVSDSDGLVQVFLLLTFTVGSRKTIQSPGLTSGPGRIIGGTLSGFFLLYFTGDGVLIEYVISAVVGAEMILHSRIGMGDGDVPESSIAGFAAGPEEQFEVHHIVDDDQKIGWFGIP